MMSVVGIRISKWLSEVTREDKIGYEYIRLMQMIEIDMTRTLEGSDKSNKIIKENSY